MGLSPSGVSKLTSRLDRLGLVSNVRLGGRRRLALSRRGLALLARRDRASVSRAAQRWSVEPVDGKPPSCWRDVPGARSRPLARTIVSYGFKVSKNYGMELTHRKAMASSTEMLWRCLGRIAERWRRERDIRAERGGLLIRGIANGLGIARNPVRRYLNPPEAMRPKPRPLRGSKLDPYLDYIDRRMAEGLENCRVLQRELRALGYEGRRSWRNMCDLAAVAASRRPRCDLRPRQGNRPRWTGAASATWTKGGGSGKCGPS